MSHEKMQSVQGAATGLLQYSSMNGEGKGLLSVGLKFLELFDNGDCPGKCAGIESEQNPILRCERTPLRPACCFT